MENREEESACARGLVVLRPCDRLGGNTHTGSTYPGRSLKRVAFAN